MKRFIPAGVLAVLVMTVLSACQKEAGTVQNQETRETSPGTVKTEEETGESTHVDTGGWDSHLIPQEIEAIPTGYDSPAKEQGTLVELNYNTYESRTYEQKTHPLGKRAIVYLPYGYSEDQRYNVFYLMHGGWSDET